jgi:hypothetical protein
MKIPDAARPFGVDTVTEEAGLLFADATSITAKAFDELNRHVDGKHTISN